jgi:hypothetical protein
MELVKQIIQQLSFCQPHKGDVLTGKAQLIHKEIGQNNPLVEICPAGMI